MEDFDAWRKPTRELVGDLTGAVGRVVVDHEHFEVIVREDSLHNGRQVLAFVERRDDRQRVHSQRPRYLGVVSGHRRTCGRLTDTSLPPYVCGRLVIRAAHADADSEPCALLGAVAEGFDYICVLGAG